MNTDNFDAQEAAKYEALRAELATEDGGAPAPQNPEPEQQPEPRSNAGAPLQKAEPQQPDGLDDAELERQATEILERERDGLRRQQDIEARIRENPVEYFKQQLAERDRSLAGQELFARVQADEDAYRKVQPDYDDACNFVRGIRERQLEAYYPDRNPHVHAEALNSGYRNAAEMRRAIINEDIRRLATQALQRGQSPAKLYRDLALSAGWKVPGQTSTAPGGRAPAGKDYDIGKLADLFVTDPDKADREWERARRAGQLG
jgi:hypothetical protein